MKRPRDWPNGWLEQDGDNAAQPVVRWLEPTTSAVDPPVRFGRWQQVTIDALDQYEVVGLRAVVEGHLGRRGERTESTAAQRAARLLARSGQARLAHVRVPASKGRRAADLLVIARAEVDLADLTNEACTRQRFDS